MANRRPVGHAFEPPTSEPVATPQRRLLTAYRASAPIWTHQDSPLPSSPQETQLNAFFMGKLDEAAGGDPDYRAALATLLRSFPQGDQAPQRPDPSQMQSLFAKVYFPTQTRTRGKGSKGGIKHHECQWSRCDYKGTLQKCIDHFFSEHIKLKFFQCDQDSCGISFTRKYDLDKHKKKQHGIGRPREQANSEQPNEPTSSRQTRSTDNVRHQPYPTAGRPIRKRPGV